MSRALLIARLVPLVMIAIVLASCSDNSSASDSSSTTVSSNATSVPNNSILGDGSHFDPIATYPDIAKYAGDNLQLSSIDFYYVHSDGTLDLNAKYQSHIYYSFFQRLDAPPTDAPPVGAGGKLNEKWYQPINVSVTGHNSSGDSPTLSRNSLQPTNSIHQAIGAPICSLKKLWSAALEKGAPENAVATIYYSERGYSFTISDTSVRLGFNSQCQLTDGTGLTPEPTETLFPR